MRFTFSLLLAATAWSCGGFCTECGPCAPSGDLPLSMAAVGEAHAGLDPTGAVVVEVRTGAPRECGLRHAFWVDAAGAVRTPFPSLDTRVIPTKNGNRFVYAFDAGTVSVAQPTTAEVALEFDLGAGAKAFTCTTADGKSLTCQ